MRDAALSVCQLCNAFAYRSGSIVLLTVILFTVVVVLCEISLIGRLLHDSDDSHRVRFAGQLLPMLQIVVVGLWSALAA